MHAHFSYEVGHALRVRLLLMQTRYAVFRLSAKGIVYTDKLVNVNERNMNAERQKQRDQNRIRRNAERKRGEKRRRKELIKLLCRNNMDICSVSPLIGSKQMNSRDTCETCAARARITYEWNWRAMSVWLRWTHKCVFWFGWATEFAIRFDVEIVRFFSFLCLGRASKLWTRKYRFNWKWNMVLIEQLCGRRCTNGKRRREIKKVHELYISICYTSVGSLPHNQIFHVHMRRCADTIWWPFVCVLYWQCTTFNFIFFICRRFYGMCPISSHAILSVQCSHILTEHRYTFGFNSIKSQFHDNEISHTRIALNETNGSKSHSLTQTPIRHGTTHDEVIWVIGLHIDGRYDVDNDQ